jgi:hypothetical protein
MDGLHPILRKLGNQAEENTKPVKPNYAEQGKIELERTAEERIVDD